MKKISTINLTRLHTEEDFGFQKLVIAEISKLPTSDSGEPDDGGSPGTVSLLSEGSSPALDNAVGDFQEKFEAFDGALKDSASVPSATVASQADDARDSSWRGAKNYLDAMGAHPDADLAATAKELEKLFDKYGDPTQLSQVEESGIIHNLLQDIEADPAEKRTAAGFDPWSADMAAKEEAFLEAVKARNEEEGARVTGIVKATRLESDAAYRQLVDTVNALVTLNGDAPYLSFITSVNALIDRQKAILKARQTKADKKKEEDSTEAAKAK